MDEQILKLKSPEDCERFAINATRLDRADLAKLARKRAVELRSHVQGASTEVERECLMAVYAYEETLYKKNGKRTRATRTWQMIERHGILPAVERAVNRPHETVGYTSLLDVGLEDFSFEAVVVKYPDLFSREAVDRSKQRIEQWKKK